jgi:hypothetical protein
MAQRRTVQRFLMTLSEYERPRTRQETVFPRRRENLVLTRSGVRGGFALTRLVFVFSPEAGRLAAFD